jgi:chemotaxis-related protein WspB
MARILALRFAIDGHRYALDTRNVVEVISRVELRPIHRAPAELSGMFIYRGLVTPVIDLVELLAGKRCPDRLSSRIVMTVLPSRSGGTSIVGLLAEQVSEAVHIEQSDTRAAVAPNDLRIGEIAADDVGMIRLLHPESLVDPAWQDALSLGSQAQR